MEVREPDLSPPQEVERNSRQFRLSKGDINVLREAIRRVKEFTGNLI